MLCVPSLLALRPPTIESSLLVHQVALAGSLAAAQLAVLRGLAATTKVVPPSSPSSVRWYADHAMCFRRFLSSPSMGVDAPRCAFSSTRLRPHPAVLREGAVRCAHENPRRRSAATESVVSGSTARPSTTSRLRLQPAALPLGHEARTALAAVLATADHHSPAVPYKRPDQGCKPRRRPHPFSAPSLRSQHSATQRASRRRRREEFDRFR